MKKAPLLLLGIALVAIGVQKFNAFGNRDALWDIISQQCIPNAADARLPAPCLKLDNNNQYVVFKDAKGPVHDLIMPTVKISGIESESLYQPDSTPFFAVAWEERQGLKARAGFPIKDRQLALAVNSKYGRSQDHFHIHLACLREEVYQRLQEQSIPKTWSPLGQSINGHSYLAKRLEGQDLVRENPLTILKRYAAGFGETPDRYGLALTRLETGDFVLLATRLSWLDFNFGSAGEILDYSCKVAKQTNE